MNAPVPNIDAALAAALNRIACELAQCAETLKRVELLLQLIASAETAK